MPTVGSVISEFSSVCVYSDETSHWLSQHFVYPILIFDTSLARLSGEKTRPRRH